ncbi:oligopeptide transport system permease protein oppC [Scardovia inopinata]|uniref:Oligopeptide transport system permease protein OppC n=2 Tax=Scardovia inopinata TaxID=78259 RepID=W5IK64_SCAIO|nr:hypothetical protein HMPREF9020_00914 [Scardovia inopinata F0304]BAR06885.1 dipeptide/oligopeptide ABC transporter permease component [Scardovia inopinata JCM 12537]SUV50950.1 oligopeptide transport system permease protein oppC [Scardovia inopinata]
MTDMNNTNEMQTDRNDLPDADAAATAEASKTAPAAAEVGKSTVVNALEEIKAEKAIEKESGKGEVKHIGYWHLIARRFFRQPRAIIGVTVFVILILIALFGGRFAKFSYEDPDFTALSAAPSADHWLGTDSSGIDMYAALCHGLGRSLTIGVLSSVITTVIAAIYGTAIAYFRGIVEKIGMWLLDMLMVIPAFLLIALMVRAANASAGWLWLVFGMSIFGWIGPARTLRTMALSLRERDYVKASKYMGVNSFTIIIRHLVPNLASIIILNLILGVISSVGSETALSFLGLGIKVPDTSLGTLLAGGQTTLQTAPWVIGVPSVALIVLCVCLMMISDALRDAVDPRSGATGQVSA